MELNVCLYCEKRLLDDNLAFCSMTCQSKEASKSIHDAYSFYVQPKSNNTVYYHRSPSLTSSSSNRSRPYALVQSISSTSFSSSISDLSIPCSYER